MEIWWKNFTLHIQPFRVSQIRWNWHRSIGYPWFSVSDPY